MSWQRIYAKGCRPRQLFTHDQGGKGSAQAAPVLMGRGDTPAEQRRSILLATANARAVQALRTADQVNVTSEDSNEVALAVEAATAAVDYAADVQEMTESGTTPGQAGKSSGRSRISVAQLGKGKPATTGELQAHYAAKGKAKGSEALEPFADGLHEDGGETAEEEVSENDMEVIPEEDEGNGDDDGTDEPADGASTLPMPSTMDPPVATTATEVATTSTTAGDPVNVEEEVNAEPENVEEEVNVEQDTEVGNARPSRVVRNDPEHEMGAEGHRKFGAADAGKGKFWLGTSTASAACAAGDDSADAGPNNPFDVWTLGPMGSDQLGWIHADLQIWCAQWLAGGDGLRAGGLDASPASGSWGNAFACAPRKCHGCAEDWLDKRRHRRGGG